jgi:hypothetical protein
VNTGRMSVIAWVLFIAGLIGINAFASGGGGAGPVIGCVAVTVLSFVYAMYLGLVAMRKGDPLLRKRGVEGTAEIVSAKATKWAMASGEYYGIGAPLVWKYGLDVTVKGRQRYRTNLYICAHLGSSGTIPVRVSRLNRKRVTVDGPALAASGGGERAQRRAIAGEDRSDRAEALLAAVTSARSAHAQGDPPRVVVATAGEPDVADELTKLADLRDRGVLSPNEFETQKAKLLGSA